MDIVMSWFKNTLGMKSGYSPIKKNIVDDVWLLPGQKEFLENIFKTIASPCRLTHCNSLFPVGGPWRLLDKNTNFTLQLVVSKLDSKKPRQWTLFGLISIPFLYFNVLRI